MLGLCQNVFNTVLQCGKTDGIHMAKDGTMYQFRVNVEGYTGKRHVTQKWSQKIAVRVTDISNKESTVYLSWDEAAKALSLNPQTVHHLGKGSGAVYKERYTFDRFEGVLVQHLAAQKVSHHRTCEDAATACGIPVHTIRACLGLKSSAASLGGHPAAATGTDTRKGAAAADTDTQCYVPCHLATTGQGDRRGSVTVDGECYIIWFISPKTVAAHRVSGGVISSKRQNPMVVKDLHTGSVSVHDSMTAAAHATGVPKPVLYNAIGKAGKLEYIHKGRHAFKRACGFLAKRCSDGEMSLYSTTAEAEAVLGLVDGSAAAAAAAEEGGVCSTTDGSVSYLCQHIQAVAPTSSVRKPPATVAHSTVRRQAQPVEVERLGTGEKKLYKNMRNCEIKMDMPRSTLSNLFNNNGKSGNGLPNERVYRKQYIIRKINNSMPSAVQDALLETHTESGKATATTAAASTPIEKLVSHTGRTLTPTKHYDAAAEASRPQWVTSTPSGSPKAKTDANPNAGHSRLMAATKPDSSSIDAVARIKAAIGAASALTGGTGKRKRAGGGRNGASAAASASTGLHPSAPHAQKDSPLGYPAFMKARKKRGPHRVTSESDTEGEEVESGDDDDEDDEKNDATKEVFCVCKEPYDPYGKRMMISCGTCCHMLM